VPEQRHECRGEARRVRTPCLFRGKNGKVRRSLGFGLVRSFAWNPLQTAGLSERARAGANGCWHLPCRRSRVRVPSSASKDPLETAGFLMGGSR
jgi:hypothetical protein